MGGGRNPGLPRFSYPCSLLRAGTCMVTTNSHQLATELASMSLEFAMFHILLTLVPAPMKIAADASATNASSNVYSIKSCPRSSLMNPINIVVSSQVV
jgi:hypothetical protein